MFYLPVIKVATQVAASIGVSKILVDIVKNNVTAISTVQTVTVKVGTFVLGSMLVEQTSKHIEKAAQDVTAWFKSKDEDELEE